MEHLYAIKDSKSSTGLGRKEIQVKYDIIIKCHDNIYPQNRKLLLMLWEWGSIK